MESEKYSHSGAYFKGEVRRIVLINKNPEFMGEISQDSPVDVIVEMEDSQRFAASLFTIKYIQGAKKEQAIDGTFLDGQFFWEPQMILVDSYEPKLIQEIITFLIEEGDFMQAFKAI